MSEVAAENLGILRQRWPALAERVLNAPGPDDARWVSPGTQPTLEVAGLRLWSAYDAEAEACTQADRVPTGSARAAVYGIGGGDLIRELLRRPELQQLQVVVLNIGLLHLLLHCLDHRDWLQDPRVSLFDGAEQPRVLTPFAVVPPCLKLGTEDTARLQDMLLAELIMPFERERHRTLAPRRQKQIEQNLGLVASDGDVSELFGIAPGSTACIAIAGPTLKHSAGWIRENRNSVTVISVDGALAPLLDMGVTPDVVVSVDDNRDTILRYFEADLAACTESTLVYSPLVHNDVLKRWPGRRLTMYTFESIYDDVRVKLPKAELFVAGSVSHPATDLAVKMGASRVLLFGADFGFPGGRIHANSAAPVDFYANAAQAGTTTRNGHGDTIPTMPSFNGYRLGLEHYIAHHPQTQFINMSRDGAFIHGVGYMDGGPQ